MVENIEDLDLTPPQTAQDNAQKVLDWRDEHGDEVNGMTRTGWVRANQLSKGEELSPEIVKKMAQFNRHRQNSDLSEEYEGEPWKDAGYVAWLGWGGDAGVDWAMRMSERVESIENTGMDTITTLSHKHKNDDNENESMDDEETTVENRDLVAEIREDGLSELDVRPVSKNTYKGYFDDLSFEDDNWSDAVDRLAELHGMARSYLTHIVRHEASGHGRDDNVPVFDEPVDTESFEMFVENIEDDVDEETYKDLVRTAQKVDEGIRELFFEMIVHDDFMHDREGVDFEQLLSANESDDKEELSEYETMEECMDYHVDQEGYSRDQAYAMCSDKMDLSEIENNEDIAWSEGDMVQWQVEPDMFGEIVHIDDERNIAMVDIMRPGEDGLASTGFTVSAGFPDLVDYERGEEEMSELQDIEVLLESNEDYNIILRPNTEDVEEMAEPGDVSEGDKVRWDSSGGTAYGEVDAVTTEGTVSAEPEGPDMEGSEDEPAYKVQVYDVEDEEWIGTETFVVHRADALTVIDDFPESRSNTEKLSQGVMPTHSPLGEYGTQSSENWGRPSYSEFANNYDLDDSFTELSVEDKRLVAAHFGRVDASSYEDAAYSDLQLPHHSPSTGNVDRAGVVAARQRLVQSDMPQSDLEAIDTHLANHLRNDFDEEDVSPIIERENSDLDTEEETYTGREIENGQLISYGTDYGRGYGRVKELTSEDKYVVEVYSAKLGGGWSAAGEERVLSKNDVSKEGKLPQSMDDVFNTSSNAEAQTVQENSDEDMESEELESDDEDESSEQLSPAKVQQVGKKVRSVAEVLSDDSLEGYLERNDLDYSADEFRDLIQGF